LDVIGTTFFSLAIQRPLYNRISPPPPAKVV
jgi:hypothetical protein